MFLVAEYCRGPFYMGWHLYLRENTAPKRNSDGGWGWVRGMRYPIGTAYSVVKFLKLIGITISGDGTTDDAGIAEFARRYPVKGRRVGGRLRGRLEVKIDKYDEINMANQSLMTDPKGRAA